MFAIFLSPAAWLGALGIFALRVSDMSCDTLRMLFVMRGRKGNAWGLGFVQSVIYVIAITAVLQHLDNPLNVIGYAAGFATGNVVGMLIEERLAIGHVSPAGVKTFAISEVSVFFKGPWEVSWQP